MTSAYSPVYSPGGDNHYSNSSYAGDGTVFHSGIVSYGIDYRDYLALQGSGIVDAHYADGEIAVAYRPDLAVVYVNGSGAGRLRRNRPMGSTIGQYVPRQVGHILPSQSRL